MMGASTSSSSFRSLQDMFCYHVLGKLDQDGNKTEEKGHLSQESSLQEYFSMRVDEHPTTFWSLFQITLRDSQAAKSDSLELIEFEHEKGWGSSWMGLDTRAALQKAFTRLGAQIDQTLWIHSVSGCLPQASSNHSPAISGIQTTTWAAMRPCWLDFLQNCLKIPVTEERELIAGKTRSVFKLDLSVARAVEDCIQVIRASSRS